MPPFSTPIDPPRIAAGRRGLLAVATSPPAPARWEQGITFQPNACGAPVPLPIVPCEDPEPLDDGDGRPAFASWLPVMLRGFDRCSTMGGDSMEARVARATAQLTATASFQAEQEFSDGVASTVAGDENPRLTNPAGWVTAFTATTSPTAPAVGLALLEDAVGDCLHGQRATIHARPSVVALWDAAGQIHMDGGLLVTANDNLVVAGPGYSGDQPSGAAAAAGSSWVYATADVFQFQAGAEVMGDGASERIDLPANTIETWVRRLSLVYTSTCCKLAAEIDITA